MSQVASCSPTFVGPSVSNEVHVDPLSRDLIRGSLYPDRTKRLGNMIGGSEDVLTHPWLHGVNWAALEACEIQVSFHLSV